MQAGSLGLKSEQRTLIEIVCWRRHRAQKVGCENQLKAHLLLHSESVSPQGPCLLNFNCTEEEKTPLFQFRVKPLLLVNVLLYAGESISLACRISEWPKGAGPTTHRGGQRLELGGEATGGFTTYFTDLMTKTLN